MVTLTPEASAELLRRIAQCKDPNPGVVVAWLPAQFDLLRSAEGKAVWTEVEPNRWVVAMMSLDELSAPDQQLFEIDGLHICLIPGTPGASDVTVVFLDGRFQVQC